MKRINWRLLAILLIFGGGLVVMSGKDFITSLKKPVDLYDLTASEVKAGMHIKTDINAALDTFASEETWTENKDGSRTPKKTSNQYYVMPVGEMEYMALEVPSSDFATLDTIMDNTYAWYMDEADDFGDVTYPFEGTIEKLDGELDQYFGEWFTDTGFMGTEDPEPYLVHYMLVRRSFTSVQVMFGIGVLLLLVAALSVVRCIRKSKQAPVEPQVAAADDALASAGIPVGSAASAPTAAPAAEKKTRTDDEYENANKTDRGMN